MIEVPVDRYDELIRKEHSFDLLKAETEKIFDSHFDRADHLVKVCDVLFGSKEVKTNGA